MRNFSIKDWAEDDQPRQKLLLKGASTLSDVELLAILINNGAQGQTALDVGRNLLQAVNNDLGKLAGLTAKEMVKKNVKGLGEKKAVHIIAALELGIRRNANGKKRLLVTCSSDIADYLRATLEFRKKEVFAVVFLNRGNKVMHSEIISEGGMTGTVADPRIILKKALEHDATSIVLCHNHPSGNLKPSMADEMLTQKIKQAASFFDITIMDHIIVSQEGYFSFADAGML